MIAPPGHPVNAHRHSAGQIRWREAPARRTLDAGPASTPAPAAARGAVTSLPRTAGPVPSPARRRRPSLGRRGKLYSVDARFWVGAVLESAVSASAGLVPNTVEGEKEDEIPQHNAETTSPDPTKR